MIFISDIYNLPELNKDSWKTENEEFWKNYRQKLTKLVKEYNSEKKLEKTPENIFKTLENHGVKWTSKYFNVTPSTIRYYRDKYNKK